VRVLLELVLVQPSRGAHRVRGRGCRRDALDAVAALARALVDDDLEQTLDLLELARAFDPHNTAGRGGRPAHTAGDRLGRPATATPRDAQFGVISPRPYYHNDVRKTRRIYVDYGGKPE
jgi:hypothetical protein